MSARPRILVIAHGHPDFAYGGGEVAAHALFQGYREHEATGETFFLARYGQDAQEGTIRLHAPNEYLWRQTLRDEFTMDGYNRYSTLVTFRSFLETVRPDIVHLHHGVHMGYDILEVINDLKPRPKIIFTLHEFIPICHNKGQMIKPDDRLCFKSSLEGCCACFPQYTAADFWLRKKRFLHFLDHVDEFVSPSAFLRQRYIDWGLAPEKIHVLENGLRPLPTLPPRPLRDNEGRNRFGFFGQINPYKGLVQLFMALDLLPQGQRKKIVLNINGANLEFQKRKFRREVEEYRKKFQKEGVVRWLGSYDPSQIDSRMAAIDWLVIPSIWWENSPVTIQEAFAFGRPVLASNLGGMAEKVHDGIDGLHVPARNPQAWADALMECAGNNKLWDKLHAGIKKPPSRNEAARQHLQLLGVI